jgi:hypothetical protein
MSSGRQSLLIVLTALLVATAVATILITPDPTDDVHAVMRPHKPLHAPAIVLFLTPLLTLLVTDKQRGSQKPFLISVNSLRLLCTCRC